MDQPQKKRSPWVYIGCGCLSLVLISAIGVVAAGYVLKGKVEDMAAGMKDPAVRTDKAKKILGASQLPAGYNAAVSLSVPMVMDMTMLSDRAPDASGEVKGFDKRAFIYFKLISQAEDRQKLRDYFEGTSDDAGAFRKTSINLRVKEFVRRGQIMAGATPVLYVAQRGETETSQGKASGLQTMMFYDCASADQKVRMGIWMGEDPDAATPAAEADFTGSVADEAELTSFASNFDPCGA